MERKSVAQSYELDYHLMMEVFVLLDEEVLIYISTWVSCWGDFFSPRSIGLYTVPCMVCMPSMANIYFYAWYGLYDMSGMTCIACMDDHNGVYDLALWTGLPLTLSSCDGSANLHTRGEFILVKVQTNIWFFFILRIMKKKIVFWVNNLRIY